MTGWIIEPQEPLIVRDGRPFGAQPGVIANTLPFPFPSTTTGAARGEAGSVNGVFQMPDDKDESRQKVEALKQLRVRGPLLAEMDEQVTVQQPGWSLLAPAPGDALLLGEKSLRCLRLMPLNRFKNSLMRSIPGITDQSAEEKELLVGPECYEAEKPAKEQPAFWRWEHFATWLEKPEELIGKFPSGDELGIRSLPMDLRTHVSIDPGTRAAREGALFGTRGLEFTNSPTVVQLPVFSQARRLALWLDVEDEKSTYHIEQQLSSMAGERRVVKWESCVLNCESFKDLLDRIGGHITKQVKDNTSFCRLILLTPAYFKQGYLPDFGLKHWKHSGVEVSLRATLVQRPQVVSGWDLDTGNCKPTRRLAPAGSVFFLKLTGDQSAIGNWVESIWMNCVSDTEQDNLDGFGLAVLGTWDGVPKEMQVKEAK